jgi:hypothetical protein
MHKETYSTAREQRSHGPLRMVAGTLLSVAGVSLFVSVIAALSLSLSH